MDKQWLVGLGDSKWYHIVSSCLELARNVAKMLCVNKRSAMIFGEVGCQLSPGLGFMPCVGKRGRRVLTTGILDYPSLYTFTVVPLLHTHHMLTTHTHTHTTYHHTLSTDPPSSSITHTHLIYTFTSCWYPPTNQPLPLSQHYHPFHYNHITIPLWPHYHAHCHHYYHTHCHHYHMPTITITTPTVTSHFCLIPLPSQRTRVETLAVSYPLWYS